MIGRETRVAQSRPMEILLVEDNPADVRLTREALSSDTLWNTLRAAKDGVEAMAYLRREGKFVSAARPDLILLDLNLRRRMAAKCWRRSRPIPTSCAYRW